MFSYSIGLYFSGLIVDSRNPALCFGVGLIATGLLHILFSALNPYFNLSVSDQYGYYLTVWVLNGFAQSLCWPSCIKLIGHWIALNPNAMLRTYSRSGLIFGLWASCQSFGNIMGSWTVTIALSNGWRIHSAFQLIGAYSMAFGLIILLVPQKPDIHLVHAAAAENESRSKSSDHPQRELIALHQSTPQRVYTEQEGDAFDPESMDEIQRRLSMLQIVWIPGVVTYALCFSCLKALNYTLFFWLPLYLDAMIGDDIVADNVSISFDVGQIIGGVVVGVLSDRVRRRSPVLFVSMLLATVPVFIFAADSKSIAVLFTLCIFSGLFIGGLLHFDVSMTQFDWLFVEKGPYNLIPSVIAQDLSQMAELKGNASAIGTIAGFINGAGSFCAALLQFVVPVILGGGTEDAAWTTLWSVLGIISLIGTMSLIKIVINDLRYITSYPSKLKQLRGAGGSWSDSVLRLFGHH